MNNKIAKLVNELANKGKMIEHLKQVIDKLTCKSTVMERGTQINSVGMKSVTTQTLQPEEIGALSTLKEKKLSERNSSNLQYESSSAENLAGPADNMVDDEIGVSNVDVRVMESPTELSVAEARVPEEGASCRRKILIFGDEYARNFRKVLELYTDKSIFSVESYVRPNVEFLQSTRDIFVNTVTYGKYDFVIFMVSTRNIDNSYSLTKGLNNLLPLSRTTNLMLL
nr:unnamed protein product [Callosobruchus analis]